MERSKHCARKGRRAYALTQRARQLVPSAKRLPLLPKAATASFRSGLLNVSVSSAHRGVEVEVHLFLDQLVDAVLCPVDCVSGTAREQFGVSDCIRSRTVPSGTTLLIIPAAAASSAEMNSPVIK